jgi:hypothetical protein
MAIRKLWESTYTKKDGTVHDVRSKGINVRQSGYNDLFMREYGTTIEQTIAVTERLEREGKIDIQIVQGWKTPHIYLKGEVQTGGGNVEEALAKMKG